MNLSNVQDLYPLGCNAYQNLKGYGNCLSYHLTILNEKTKHLKLPTFEYHFLHSRGCLKCIFVICLNLLSHWGEKFTYAYYNSSKAYPYPIIMILSCSCFFIIYYYCYGFNALKHDGIWIMVFFYSMHIYFNITTKN